MKRPITRGHLEEKRHELSLKNSRIDEYLELKKKWQDQEGKFLEYLNQGVYNGVTGLLPAWVPTPIKLQFNEARLSIFDNTPDTANKPHDPENIKFILDTLSNRKGIFADPEMWVFPSRMVVNDDLFVSDLKYLIWLWQTIQLGKRKALREIAGETSYLEYETLIVSNRQSKSAKLKKGKEGALKAAIRKLATKNLDDLLDAFQDSETVEDLFFADNNDNRIDIHEIEVNEDKKYISYRDRNGRSKTATFKTLINHIASL